MTEVNVIVFIVFFPTCSPNALAYQVAKLKRIGKLSLSLFFNMRQCRWRVLPRNLPIDKSFLFTKKQVLFIFLFY